MKKLLDKIGILFEMEKVEELGYGIDEGVTKEALLNEAIPISLYRQWHKKLKELKGHGGTSYKERFDSWFTPKTDASGRRLGSKYRVYIPLGGKIKTTKKMLAPNDIKSALEKEGWEIEDYNKGMAVKKGGDKKEVKAEAWDSKKQYKALDFVTFDGKTYKAIKNPAIGVSPTDNKERQWLDFEKAGGGGKKVEKSIGGILADLTASAKKSGDTEKEKLYSGLERKNQTLQGRIKGSGTDDSSSSASKYVVISRHPYDVMGASTDRGWASCQNIGIGQDDYSSTQQRGNVKKWDSKKEYKQNDMVISGDKIYRATSSVSAGTEPPSSKWEIDDQFKLVNKKNKETGVINKVAVRQFDKDAGGICRLGRQGAYYHGIGADVRYGAMVAYVVDAEDMDINNPISRMLIKPYVKMEGKDKGSVFLFASPSQYGSKTGSRAEDDKIFRKTVEDWLEENQSGEGVYQIKQKSISSGEPFASQSWEHHYPEERSSIEAKSYKGNSKNVSEFKDGLTWDDVINQHRWFAKNTFNNVVIGEEYGKLIMYSGNVTDGTWDDDAEALSGKLQKVFITKGKFKDVTLNQCEVTTGDFDSCNMNNTTWKIRGKLNNCDVNGIDINGSIKATKSNFNDAKFTEDIPEGSVLTFTECEFTNSKNLKGKFIDCVFKDGVTLSSDVNIINATYDGLNQDGGSFSGTLKSGTIKNAKITKIIAKGGTLVSCDIKHGIIENATLKNCDFHAGIFGYTPGLGKKTVSKLKPKSSRNRSKFFGGNFFGGTFAGGDFTKGVWHDKAKWTGGYWHGGENKPANASTKEDVKVNKNIDIKARLLAKTQKNNEEE